MKLACVVPEKNVTEVFVTPTQDDRSDPYMSPPLKRVGDTKMSYSMLKFLRSDVLKLVNVYKYDIKL